MQKKTLVKYFIIALLLVFVTSSTFCAFTISSNKTGSITTTELSTTFLNNADLLTKVQALDSSITSIDKNIDLIRVNTLPTITFTNSNIVSTSNSSVPTYLWVDNGNIYYYTIATNVDLNNV